MRSTQQRLAAALSAAAAASGALALTGCGADASGSDRHDDAVKTAIASVSSGANSIGRPGAPYTLTLYTAPTSPTLSGVVLPQLPTVVDRYVRGGSLKVAVRTLGGSPYANSDDALQGSRLIQAAGLQGRFWPALVQFAGRYNGALVTLDQDRVLRAARVGSVSAAMKARNDPRVTAAIRRANSLAAEEGSRRFADAYVVANARGVRINVTADATHGHLADGVGAAMKLIAG